MCPKSNINFLGGIGRLKSQYTFKKKNKLSFVYFFLPISISTNHICRQGNSNKLSEILVPMSPEDIPEILVCPTITKG